MSLVIPDRAAIDAARERIGDLAVRTPLIRLQGCARDDIYLKLEMLQPVGSFKIRCAANALAVCLIASAVCALLGPIFVPFFIVPKLDWLFWGWLKSFIQYSFIPVVAIAFLMVFEQFVFRYVTTLPPTITQAEHGIYALQAVAVIVTFVVGMLLVPSLTSNIFSGGGGESVLSPRIAVGRLLRR